MWGREVREIVAVAVAVGRWREKKCRMKNEK